MTKNLRPYDAGIMELGLVYTDKMAIPPKMESFALSGHCLPECTAVVSKIMPEKKSFIAIFHKTLLYLFSLNNCSQSKCTWPGQ